MRLEDLKAKRQELVLQRAAAKEQVEALDKVLGQIGFAIQVLEAPEEPEAQPEAETVQD